MGVQAKRRGDPGWSCVARVAFEEGEGIPIRRPVQYHGRCNHRRLYLVQLAIQATIPGAGYHSEKASHLKVPGRK